MNWNSFFLGVAALLSAEFAIIGFFTWGYRLGHAKGTDRKPGA